MHILYVTRELPPSLRCGGIGSYVWDIARQVVKYGHQATVICASDDTRNSSDSIIEGVRVLRLAGGDFAIRGVERTGNHIFGRNWRALSRYYKFRRKLADCIDSIMNHDAADLVEFPEYGTESLVWMNRPRSIPLVIRLHTPTSLDRFTTKRISRSPFRLLHYFFALHEYVPLRSADAITACSHALAEWVLQDAGLMNRNVVTIPNPIDFNEWHTESFHTVKNTNSGIHIFFAGTVVEGKGVGELVCAVTMLRKKVKNIYLTLAGRLSEFGHQLEKQRKKNSDMRTWLKLLGPVSRTELKNLYSIMDIVCFPSWWEGLGIVCIEAMACGALVVGSSAGGMTEIIRDGIDGFLVEPKNPEKLADCLSKVLSLPVEKQREIRLTAQERVRTSFDMSVIMPQMLSFYEEIIRKFTTEKNLRS